MCNVVNATPQLKAFQVGMAGSPSRRGAAATGSVTSLAESFMKQVRKSQEKDRPCAFRAFTTVGHFEGNMKQYQNHKVGTNRAPAPLARHEL